MPGMTESCSICGSHFDVQFRYQMEERDGGFSFYCSQACLKKSQGIGTAGFVSCDACSKRFQIELVSNVFYVKGQRRYACSMDCRAQLAREVEGARLGEEIPRPPPVHLAPPLPAETASPSPPETRAPRTWKGPHVIAVFNHKGGTGKTTTSVNLAAGLAAEKKRVLLVDTDSQGNVGVSLDIKGQRSLYHVVVMGLAVSEVVTRVRENLDVVPANESLAAAELYLAGRQNR